MEIVRIVRLSIAEDKVQEFLAIFEKSKALIKAFDGCNDLKLFIDHNHKNIFYTYSQWTSINHLENYRNSELFKNTWHNTKLLFDNKPMAFSLEQLIHVLED